MQFPKPCYKNGKFFYNNTQKAVIISAKTALNGNKMTNEFVFCLTTDRVVLLNVR